MPNRGSPHPNLSPMRSTSSPDLFSQREGEQEKGDQFAKSLPFRGGIDFVELSRLGGIGLGWDKPTSEG